MSKKIFTGISDSGNGISTSKMNKKPSFFFFTVLATILIVLSGAGAGADDDNVLFTPSHAVAKTACSTTLYPELCFSAVAAEAGFTEKVSTHKDVIALSLNITIRSVENNTITIKNLQSRRKGLTKREKSALKDCLELTAETLDEIHKAISDLSDTVKHADDLKTLISAAITNQETCLDGFSHDKADRRTREGLKEGQLHVERLCSNALAMITNVIDTESKTVRITNRKLMEEKDDGNGIQWPEWMSAADRRLLQSSTVAADVVVAADGSGNYRTVSEAVAAAPERSSNRYVIRIKAGVYRENVDVTSRHTNLMFVGDGQVNTIITASRNVVDGSTTFNSATVAVVGEGFLARDITFQNAAGPEKHQAVALRAGADLAAFYRCGFIAFQDTLYVHSNRQFFVNCYVAGTIDFIFGNSAAVLQDCDIHARRPGDRQKNMVTASGRTDPNQNTGIVIHRSRIGATQDLEATKSSFPTYLGRPWKEYARTVILHSTISDIIDPAGWYPWDGNFALDTLYYAEYKNTGPGSDTSRRVNWQGYKVITSTSEAQAFAPSSFISANQWLPNTGFPFRADL